MLRVKFYGRNAEITYTKAIYKMLLTDPAVEYILDAETGEVLYNAE